MAWLSAGFWIGAATLAGAAVLLVLVFARRSAVGAAAGGEGEAPALAVHRRQLAEIDDLAERGLIGEGEKAAVRAEAGRRLLSAAGRAAKAGASSGETSGSPASRLTAAALAAAAAVLALLLYREIGAPGVADQPYRTRVAAWKAADPATLDPARMAAVLKTITKDRPADPEAWSYLGRAEMAAGDPFAATRAFAAAARLAPARADYRIEGGEADLAAADGQPAPDAAAAFRAALALDPHNVPARFVLGRLSIQAGDKAAGLATWRALIAELPAADPRRTMLSAEIARIAAGGPLDPAPVSPAADGAAPGSPSAGGPSTEASAFIQGMVASLAARLAAHPDDGAGWAQLVRSYGVLHDAPAQAAALARARRQFAGRPQALSPIEAEAKTHPA